MKQLSYIMTLLLVVGLGRFTYAQTVKIGYTNVELIMAYMPESEAIEKQLVTLEKKLGQSLEVKQKYFQQKMAEYQEKKQSGVAMSEAEEKATITEIQKLQGEVQTGVENAQRKLFEKRMVLLKPLQDRLQKAIDQVAAEGGYTYILNQAVGAGIPSILYGKDALDVTEAIARKLGIDVDGE